MRPPQVLPRQGVVVIAPAVRIDRMRKTLERSQEITRQRERRVWLDAMEPWHREWHKRPVVYYGMVSAGRSVICGECSRLALERANARIMEAAASLPGAGR